jgi:type I restriction enzyme S subunit
MVDDEVTELARRGEPSLSVPRGWKPVRLLDVVELPSGQVDPREEPYSSWPLVAPNHIESGSGRMLPAPSAREQGAISGKYVFEAGDVLYSKIRPYLRKAALARSAGLCSADMYPLRPKAQADAGFILGILLSQRFTNFASSVSMRTGIPKINREELAHYWMALPPLTEQRKVAAILSSVDDAIAATQAVIYELDVVRSGLLASAMAGKLTSSRSPTRATPIGDMPKHWTVVSLNEVAQVKGGKRLPKGHPFAQTRTAYPYVRVSDLVEDSISTTDIKFISEEDHRATARYTISSDDLYISIAGTLGVVGEVPAELDGAHLTENAAKICQIDARRLDRTFLMFALQSDAAQDQLGRAKGVGAGVPKLALFRILTTLLPLPPLAEQQRIVGVLKSVRERVVQTRAKVVAMSGLKSGLADALLSGRLRVIDADVAA